MNALLKVLFSHCRSNTYLMIGICLGLSLSLYFAPVEIERCTEESLPYVSNARDPVDEYEPRLNIEGKPSRAQKSPKVFVRPRYYSTELGIRDKLFVGVITSQEYLHSRAVAQNKTIAHLVQKVRYFISIPEGGKPNVSLPGIVGFTDTRSILKPFHVLKYITDNYLEDYDYYFLIKDSSYVNARRLMELVDKISVSRDVHLGISSEDKEYCSLDAGVLLSNSVVRNTRTNLGWCVKNTFSDSDDTNFGRCIMRSTSIPCAHTIQGRTVRSTKLKPAFNFEKDLPELTEQNHFDESITVYPIYDHLEIYKMNAYFAKKELEKVQDEISKVRGEILGTARSGPYDKRNVTWPVGNQQGNKPPGRFDVARWTCFNETHTFLETEPENVRESKGSDKMDIEYVINATVQRIIGDHHNKLKYKSLLNGYKRYDASRGMDYILDLIFTNVRTGKELNKRIQVCKPLGKVEILPVPYVTENSRINLILTVNSFEKNEAMGFVSHYAQACMEKKDKTGLMLVLLYDPDSASKGKEDIFYDLKQYALLLTDKYKKDRSKVSWLSIRLPSAVNSIELDPLLKVAVADLAVKKFPPDSLILFVEAGMELRVDYLNRVRLNTINQWQVFSPIPFSEFNPDIVYADSKHVEPDVNRNYGRYDVYNYNHVAFYAGDYTTTRKIIDAKIPLVRSDKDIFTILKLSDRGIVGSIFELFAAFNELLHPFRAVEPALKIRYKEINCGGTNSDEIYKNCLKARTVNLGNRGQLAKLILDYQSHH